MPLRVGNRIGHFEILTLLGQGGMGEVYRARDTKLKRDVALKVLPEAFARDPERMARFQREAEVLASLNHTNIAQIYGVEERALAMELVEGEAPKGPIPFDEAWKIASQIAAALEYAHDKGIIHRDLKPANIKVTADGTVKLLDFGLAKAFTNRGEARSSNSAENSPTLTIGATEVGVILGTAQYMPPEQAMGKAVDKRADIWSFGVVLCELLTGERLFKGDDTSDTLAQVLTKEPDLSGVPPKARKLLEECLQKDPKQRLRDIGDADRLLGGPPLEPAVATSPSWSRLGWVWPGAAALMTLATFAVSFVHFRETRPTIRVFNSALLPPDGAEFDFGGSFALPALSPDGTRIIFGAKLRDGVTQLYVRRLDSPTAQPLPGTEEAMFPFWSPDSRWVAFGQATKLKKIDVQGGPPVALTDLQGALRGGSWSPAGVIIFGTRDGNSIFRVAAEGGTAAPATALEGTASEGHPVYPWFLPDGRHFLYTSRLGGDIPVRVASLDGPGKLGKVVAQAQSGVVYAQGHLLYLRENTLMAQPFDSERLETRGEAMPLAEGVPTFLQPSRGAAFTVSAGGGLLAYQSSATSSQSRLVWRDRQGNTLGTLGEAAGAIVSPVLSPDGKRLAARISDRSGNGSIWIYDTARGISSRFTFGATDYEYPHWSPDGNTLYFGSTRQGALALFRKASNGAGAEDLLLGDSEAKSPTSVSPDGQVLLYSNASTKTGLDLWVLPLAQARSGGKPEPWVFLRTPFGESDGRFSPDGRWVAYVSDESGQYEIYAASFPGPERKLQISSGGGWMPSWRSDGKELFYVTPGGQLMAAEVTEANGTLEIGRVQKLFEGVWTSSPSWDVSADGQKFIVVENTATATARPLTLVQNWTAALRK
ncbi:MAG: protein kinase [Bryobacteraceae bacterium]|jgi:serine/threonine protein kinase